MSETRDDLRQRVDELEATIRGLTQELVEANERIRQLEDELDATPETIVAGDEGEPPEEAEESTKPMGTEMETDPDGATETDTPMEDGSEDEDTDDIIVA
ncbi:MAG: hypothetical protein ABEH66_01475 [Halobacteriales archaeon]